MKTELGTVQLQKDMTLQQYVCENRVKGLWQCFSYCHGSIFVGTD